MIRYIANSKFSKVVSFLMAFLILFNNVIFPTRAFALTGGPSQPEFNSFDPAGGSEMVNLFTGDFSYNIPLMDVDGYPINIAYHASPGMDDEASWTGLGWNINAGAINRGMRGLPDDFNGDPVNRELNISPFRAWGVSVGVFGELFGGKLSAGGSMGVGVFHTNYTGFGIELNNNVTLGLSSGKNVQGQLTAGLGVKLNSQDGMDIYPSLGVSGKLERTKRTTSLGVNIGCSINSRDGLKSVSGGYSISSQKTQKPTGRLPGERTPGENGGGEGIGLAFGSSASIPMSSQGFMPKAMSNMSSQAYNLDFKLGTNTCFYAYGVSVSGYYAENKMNPSQRNKDFAAYGYLFSQNAGDNDMMDFNREKDGMMYPELPNMPISNYTFDMFSANAQGLSYAFRPHRNDIGILHDNATVDNSFGLGVGAELMFSTDVNVGVNINMMYADGETGRWDKDNEFNKYAEFTSDVIGTDYEAAYFKVAGEKTSDDSGFLNSITNSGDEPYAVQISKKAGTVYEATDKFYTSTASAQPISGSAVLKKSKRAVRNEMVSYLNAAEASKFALDTAILDYPELTQASFAPAGFDDAIIRTSAAGPESKGELVSANINKILRTGSYCGDRLHHISEMTITQNNGSRYVYGIPMYNRKQVDAMFNTDFAHSDKTNATVDVQGLVSYNPTTDASASNGNGIDNYMEKNTMRDYSRGFLLTSVLSSDYVDRTGNGPSVDDYGDYTKFNYSRMGNEGAYAWRMPVEHEMAKFNQGLMADKLDNKGAYLYGEKDLWYMQSIETKNYIAFFVLNNPDTETRKDAYPVANEDGGRSASNLSRYLKEIRLYAKKDFAHGGIANARPIKVVNFEYDYSLCPGVPNNINTSATGGLVQDANGTNTNGKLTLKKIWFTYGNSQKGKSSPYSFSYADLNHDGTQDCNYSYNSASVDRWGAYKPTSQTVDNCMDFPYVDQTTANNNAYAAAWSLTQIKTPAGSAINVSYEADDYAYVQNKEAGQLFKVDGLSSAAQRNTTSTHNLIYGNNLSQNFVIIDLKSEHAGIPVGMSVGNAKDALSAKYLKGLEKVYFRFKVDMDNKGKYEFVPGYADVVDYGVLTGDGTYQVSGSTQNYYRYAYLEMKQLGINDKDQASPTVSPIAKAAFQMGRMYLPQIVFPGSQPGPNVGPAGAVKGLVTTIKDSRYILKGVNKALYERDVAKSCDLTASTLRLYNPDGFKKGGGARVSKITVNDGWNAMSGENEAEYGQVYTYTTKHPNGFDISSGVASYEPIMGGDENSMRHPVDFAIKKYFAPSDEYFQEEPLGESFFPDAVVGYSKITVKNIPKANVNAHATGRTEYEFYTAKDFPVITDRTILEKPRVKPKLLRSILKFGSTDKLFMSQGYVIKTNDMHGKLRSQKMYAENGGNTAISGITYYYKTKTGNHGQELDNTANVIDKNNAIVTKTIGKNTDFYTDSRSSVNDTYTGGIGLNIQTATCTYYVPLVFVWPSFGHEHREFKSIGTTKLIQQYGLIDYAEAFENSSVVKTKNLLYDDVSGEVVLTETANDFDAPVYNLKYPAYWAYQDMGAAFANAGISFNPTVITNTGMVDPLFKQYFRPGDEIGIFDNTATPKRIFTKAWIVEDKAGSNEYYFVTADGHKFIPSVSFKTPVLGTHLNRLKILRSGRRNLQSAPMGSAITLKNPVTANTLNVTTATGVVNASAVEYSEVWHLLLGDIETPVVGEARAPANSLVCGKLLGDIINPYVENIRGNWRVKKSYSYLQDRQQTNQTPVNMKGDIREDGTYTNYAPFWNYSSGTWKNIYDVFGSYDKWVKNNELEKVNEYGASLYARDVLNRASATIYGYNHTLPVAAANNATYNQLAFDGFEDYDFIHNECSALLSGTPPAANTTGYIEHFSYYAFKSSLTTTESHTGRYSMQVPANGEVHVKHKLTNPAPAGTPDDVPYTIKEKDNYGLFAPYYSYSKDQKFVLSVWAKQQVLAPVFSTTPVLDYGNIAVTISLAGFSIATTPKKSAIINGWQKLDYEFTVPAGTPPVYGSNVNFIQVGLKNNGTTPVFYDDIRIHPFNSSMKSMVYDPYSLRLMAEMDDRNFATFYEYDEEGTLVRMKKETEKGIYTIKESRAGLKK